VRCVVITGAGRAFCSGADLADLEPAYRAGEKLDLSTFLRARYHLIILPIIEMEKPVIAAVNGIAAGAGASLAFACDIRIASDKARFMQAFVKVGLVPDSGANYFLPRLLGTTKALELAMTGDLIDSAEALRLGLVNRVVEHDRLAEEVRSWAEPFAHGPTRAYGLTKKAIHFGSTHALASTLEYEADLQAQLGLTADHREGVMAFLEKRAPSYQGR
jgi:2-(1,2-epoxy-1,2-dihydrophenyl)acetyl-CoA isomerase